MGFFGGPTSSHSYPGLFFLCCSGQDGPMCGRFTQLHTWNELHDLYTLIGQNDIPNLQPRYNVTPSQDVAAVRYGEAGARELVRLRWGLIPSWAKDEKIGYKTINARAETVAEKPSFRAAFRKRRCLIPVSGFYEWQAKGKGAPKQPHYITGRDTAPLTFAGLWERWDGADQPVESCTIIVTTANAFLQPIHHRMPVILAPEDFDAWLDLETTDAHRLLRPCPDDRLESYPVSTRVNSPKNDDPTCIEAQIPSNNNRPEGAAPRLL